MKFLVERDALRDGLAVVVGRTKGTGQNGPPILTHVLIESHEQAITLTGHDLDSCSQATMKAEVSDAGSIALPADRFARLVGGLAEGSQVIVDADDKQAKVKCGRSTYQFQLMAADQFPGVLTPKNPAKFTLTAKQVARLFKQPQASVCDEAGRYYLCGIYLHRQGERLAACATNGHTLIRTISDAKTPQFENVIVPTSACVEIVKVTGGDDARIEISSALIAIEAGTRRYVSKLIDGTFPDYQQVIPQAQAPVIAMDSKEFDAALARLVTACDPEMTVAVKLSWRDDVEQISATLHSKFGDGAEQIECDCPGRNPGEVGAQVEYFREVVGALGGDRFRLFVDGPGDPMRLENPDDPDVVAVVMPCRV